MLLTGYHDEGLHEQRPPIARIPAAPSRALAGRDKRRRSCVSSPSGTVSFIEDFKRLLAWIAPSAPPRLKGTRDDIAAIEATRAREAAEKQKEARQRIASSKRSHWQPLLDLIPEIEAMAARGEKFGEMKGGEQAHWWSAIQLPWMDPSPIVNRFSALVVELGGFVPFEWERGDEDAGDGAATAAADFDRAKDVFTTCQRFTALMQSDLYVEGALVAAFESGQIVHLLKLMDRQLRVPSDQPSPRRASKLSIIP